MEAQDKELRLRMFLVRAAGVGSLLEIPSLPRAAGGGFMGSIHNVRINQGFSQSSTEVARPLVHRGNRRCQANGESGNSMRPPCKGGILPNGDFGTCVEGWKKIVALMAVIGAPNAGGSKCKRGDDLVTRPNATTSGGRIPRFT